MVRIQIVSIDHWAASSLFNPNAYPSSLKGLAASCTVRAGILRYHVRNTTAHIEADRAELAQLITSRWDTQFKPVLEADDNADAWVQCASLGYLSVLDGVLISLKSLLDVYATLISRSFVPNKTLKFNRGNVKNNVSNTERSLSGGRLIAWLRQSVPDKDAENANAVANIITRHSEEWLTDAVELRDQIAHFGEIRALKPVGTSLRSFSESGFNPQAMSGPYMPDDRDVPSYCESILSNTSVFLEETIANLPSINMEFIGFGVYGKISR